MALSELDTAGVWGAMAPVIRAADLAVVNVECPLANNVSPVLKSGPSLWGPESAATGIRMAGFTTACLANNHILDAGSTGLYQTIQACNRAGLDSVGAGVDHFSATQPLVRTIGALTLSLLAFAENEFSTTTGSQPGAWPFDLVDNARQIAAARAASDYVLVLYHGGAEQYPLPSPRMQKACRFFVDAGADAVVCHHSHVAGGTETYQGCPIVYGTGNLLFSPVDGAPEGWMTGYLVSLEIDHHRTCEMQLIPYHQDPTKPAIVLMSGTERSSFLSNIVSLGSVIAEPAKLQEHWAAFCRRRRSFLLASLLCLTKPESWLLDKDWLPTVPVRLTPPRIAGLRNLFSCESHAEACEQMLRDLLDEKTNPR